MTVCDGCDRFAAVASTDLPRARRWENRQQATGNRVSPGGARVWWGKGRTGARAPRGQATSVALFIMLVAAAPPDVWAEPQPTTSSSPEMLLQNSKDPLLRETAAQILGQRGASSAVPLLVRALRADDNRWVRGRCAEALGMIGSPAALSALRAAMEREKDQRVRRMIAQAQLRLGQTAGIRELMWQLKSGTNYAKAEAMELLVRATGQPLGQDADAWWTYLDARGNMAQALRPRGSPAVVELRGVASDGGARRGPLLYAQHPPAWQQLPAVVLDLAPTREPVSRAALESIEKRRGLPDGCLLLLRTGWRDTKPPADDSPALREPRLTDRATPHPRLPFLGVEAARYLLQRAPRLLGVGIDAPTLDDPSGAARPARTLLVAKRRLVLESVDDLDRLSALGGRVVLVHLGPAPAGAHRVRALAIIP